MFELHPQLAKDCFVLGDFPLSRLLMMNDYHYPWFILVPRKENIKESFELDAQEQQVLNEECNFLARTIKQLFSAHKMNIAALGNQVPQLHVHVIARYDFDTCWPSPIWGRAQHLAFEKHQLLERINKLIPALQEGEIPFKWDSQWI